MFGMVALLEGSRKRNASIKVTSQHCTVFSLKKTDILPLIDQSELKDIEDERLARRTGTDRGTNDSLDSVDTFKSLNIDHPNLVKVCKLGDGQFGTVDMYRFNQNGKFTEMAVK